MTLYEKHLDLINSIIDTKQFCGSFEYFTQTDTLHNNFNQHIASGEKKFADYLNNRFEDLRQGKPSRWLGEEESPYTQEFLGITYPAFEVNELLKRGKEEYHNWRKADKFIKAGLLVESIERISRKFGEIAAATMNTTGQNHRIAFFNVSLACDYALCVVGAGVGKINEILAESFPGHRRKVVIPRGISLIIGDSSAPVLNVLPSLFASLITGNVAIIKPHPKVVAPLAIAIAEIQKTLSENGFNPNICQLAIDSYEGLISDYLAVNNATRIIDFYGSNEFGKFLEKIPGKTIFSFKRGINPVLIQSIDNLEQTITNLAVSAVFYSGQRFDSYQNIFFPKEGVETDAGNITPDEFIGKLANKIGEIISGRETALQLSGAVQNIRIFDRIKITQRLDGEMIINSDAIHSDRYESARTASPMIMKLANFQKEIFNQKYFGPILFFIETENFEQSLALAKETALQYCSNICYAYVQDKAVKEKIIDHMALVNVPVCLNEAAMSEYFNAPADFELIKQFVRTRINHIDFVLKRFNVLEVWEK